LDTAVLSIVVHLTVSNDGICVPQCRLLGKPIDDADCRFACSSDQDCAGGWECDGQACVPVTIAPDPCLSVQSCSDYAETRTCIFDTCSLDTVCYWDVTPDPDICSDCTAIDSCSDYDNQEECEGSMCGLPNDCAWQGSQCVPICPDGLSLCTPSGTEPFCSQDCLGEDPDLNRELCGDGHECTGLDDTACWSTFFHQCCGDDGIDDTWRNTVTNQDLGQLCQSTCIEGTWYDVDASPLAFCWLNPGEVR
jgi:hypothetical protein